MEGAVFLTSRANIVFSFCQFYSAVLIAIPLTQVFLRFAYDCDNFFRSAYGTYVGLLQE
jgi:hypothetical protein